MPAGDHAAEVDALGRRFPGWTIWFGLFTRRWWALPPRDRGAADLIEADTPQRLITGIEVVEHTAPPRAPGAGPATDDGRTRPSRDLRQDVRGPSNLLRLEGVTTAPSGRTPAVAWPGGTPR